LEVATMPWDGAADERGGDIVENARDHSHDDEEHKPPPIVG